MFCQKDLILLELGDLNLSKRGLRQNFGFGISQIFNFTMQQRPGIAFWKVRDNLWGYEWYIHI